MALKTAVNLATLACLALALISQSHSARMLLAFQPDIRSGDRDTKLAVASNLQNAYNTQRECADDFTIDTQQVLKSCELERSHRWRPRHRWRPNRNVSSSMTQDCSQD